MARLKNIKEFTESLGVVSEDVASAALNITGGEVVSCQAVIDVESGAKTFESPDDINVPDSEITITAHGYDTGTEGQLTALGDPVAILSATLAASPNAQSAAGSTTGTLHGTAAIAGGVCNMTGGTAAYLSYSAVDNMFTTQGVIQFSYKPDYTGAPSDLQVLFSGDYAGNSANSYIIYHENSSGNLTVTFVDSSGTNIVAEYLGVWEPTSGVTYVMKFVADFVNGNSKFYINGVQFGITMTGTGAIDAREGLILFGTGDDLTTYTPDFSISNVVISSTAGTLPAPLEKETDYYVIVIDANTIQFAESLEDANDGVFIELEDDGPDNTVSTFTPSTLADGAIQLQKSNDGDNWSDEGSPVSITADGNVYVEKVDPSALYYRAAISITDGSFDCDLNWVVKGIDG